MQDVTRDLLVSLAAFAGIFGMFYVFIMTRYRERMAMLERGVDPSVFNNKGKHGSLTLKWGMLLVGIAFGILIGHLLYRHDILDEEVAFFSMTFLFGGISLILNFIIDRKFNK